MKLGIRHLDSTLVAERHLFEEKLAVLHANPDSGIFMSGMSWGMAKPRILNGYVGASV